MRLSVIGWLAGGLAESERVQLVSKLAPAGSSWLIQFVLDRLPTSADREQLAFKLHPERSNLAPPPVPPLSLKDRVWAEPAQALAALRAQLPRKERGGATREDWCMTFAAAVPKPDAAWLATYIRSGLSDAERRKLAQTLHPSPPPPVATHQPAPETLQEMVTRDPHAALEAVRAAGLLDAATPARSSAPALSQPPRPRHPQLGTLLRDLGHKRLYSLTVSQLLDSEALPVWQMQRSYRPDRAVKIAKAKTSDPRFGTFPGVITLWSDRDNEVARHEILDGQHRVGALRILLEQGAVQEDDEVLVEVHALRGHDAAAALFTEINQAQPVKLVDMPGVTDQATRVALEGACTSLRERFPAMFSNSERCRLPHLNVDTLKDKLFQADILPRHNLKTSKQLLDWLMAQNAELATRSDEEWMSRQSPRKGKVSVKKQEVFTKALARAREHGMYLGLDEWSWLD